MRAKQKQNWNHLSKTSSWNEIEAKSSFFETMKKQSARKSFSFSVITKSSSLSFLIKKMSWLWRWKQKLPPKNRWRQPANCNSIKDFHRKSSQTSNRMPIKCIFRLINFKLFCLRSKPSKRFRLKTTSFRSSQTSVWRKISNRELNLLLFMLLIRLMWKEPFKCQSMCQTHSRQLFDENLISLLIHQSKPLNHRDGKQNGKFKLLIDNINSNNIIINI